MSDRCTCKYLRTCELHGLEELEVEVLIFDRSVEDIINTLQNVNSYLKNKGCTKIILRRIYDPWPRDETRYVLSGVWKKEA